MDELQAVCFDAYGTLCRVRQPRHPYLRLFGRLGIDLKRAARLAMTTGHGLAELSAALAPGSGPVPDGLLADLEAELASVELFEDAAAVLAEFTRAGVRSWVVSNLAPPYAGPLRRLLAGQVYGFSLSCEVGAVKPGPAIFAHACAGLGVAPGRVLMVGDSPRADVAGARAFGMRAVRLARGEASVWPDRIQSLSELLAGAEPSAAADPRRIRSF